MLVIRAEKELDVYRIVFNAVQNAPMPAVVTYIGKAKPRGVKVLGLREDLLPQIPGYLVYRTGVIEYPGVIIGVVTRGRSRYEAADRLLAAIESYKAAVVKEEL